jgi:hypothetical protein
LMRTAARCHPSVYLQSPSIAAYTPGGRAGDAGGAAARVAKPPVQSGAKPRSPPTRGKVEDGEDSAVQGSQ